jgi:hypothetical protein
MPTTTTPATPAPAPNLDIDVINNGVKLLGEAVVPGASLLMEKHIAAGLGATALGVLGSAALGSFLGPLGYILGRYGTSAAAFALSVQPPPTNGTAATAQAVAESAAAMSSSAQAMEAHTAAVRTTLDTLATRMAQAQAFTPPPTASADLAEQIATALRRVMPELASSVRAAMEAPTADAPPPPRRGGAGD